MDETQRVTNEQFDKIIKKVTNAGKTYLSENGWKVAQYTPGTLGYFFL